LIHDAIKKIVKIRKPLHLDYDQNLDYDQSKYVFKEVR
jgi:hypothetical protein